MMNTLYDQRDVCRKGFEGVHKLQRELRPVLVGGEVQHKHTEQLFALFEERHEQAFARELATTETRGGEELELLGGPPVVTVESVRTVDAVFREHELVECRPRHRWVVSRSRDDLLAVIERGAQAEGVG